MTRKMWQRVSWPVVFAGLSAPFFTHCGGELPAANAPPGAAAPAGLPAVPGVTGGGGGCPDMAKVEAIESFDFEKEFKLKADVAAKIRSGAAAAAEMSALNAKIDEDLKVACGALARDLGVTGDFKDGQDACKAAEKGIADVKGKIGAKAKITVDVAEPHCGVDVHALRRLRGALRRVGQGRQGRGQVRAR